MAIDASQFYELNVADTCALWNLLSSALLHRTAISNGIYICITSYVRYECLDKPRSAPHDEKSTLKYKACAILQQKLQAEITANRIRAHSISVADLQQVEILERRKKLGKGELTSIAFAMSTKQAFLTDDQKARKLASAVLPPAMTQTTPHLLAWLFFHRHLTDGDKTTVIDQHKASCGELTPHLEEAYRIALESRLMQLG